MMAAGLNTTQNDESTEEREPIIESDPDDGKKDLELLAAALSSKHGDITLD
jgi:hypothetical protein